MGILTSRFSRPFRYVLVNTRMQWYRLVGSQTDSLIGNGRNFILQQGNVLKNPQKED